MCTSTPATVARNSAGLIGPGLDVRGDGGYCILPSPGSGYFWDPLHNFETVAMARAPDWLWPPKPSRPPRLAGPIVPVQGLGCLRVSRDQIGMHRHCQRRAEGSKNARSTRNASASVRRLERGSSPGDVALRALLRAAGSMRDHDGQWPWRPRKSEHEGQTRFRNAGQAHPREVGVPWLDADPEVEAERAKYRGANGYGRTPTRQQKIAQRW